MTKPKKKGGVDPDLEKAIGKLLKQVMTPMTDGTEHTITDKMKVIDRALKLAAIKAKMTDDGYGSGFFGNEEVED